MSEPAPLPRVARAPVPARKIAAHLFYVVIAGALLALVLVGFARTFYLRAWFDVPPIPAYMYLHGALMTAWFVVFLVQTCLIAARRVDLHRRLGIAGVGIAALLVPVNAFVTAWAVPDFLARGMDPVRISGIALGDLVALVAFSTFVAVATYLRRQPAIHKRLMTLACVALIGPAVSRLNQQELLNVSGLAVFLGPVVMLLAHDVFTARRLHGVTVVAGGLMVGGFLAAQAISASAGEVLVAALSGPRAIRAAQPILRVDDVGAAIEWYQTVLGFTTLARDPAAEPSFAIVQRDRVEIFLRRGKSDDAPVLSTGAVPEGWPTGRADVYLRIYNIDEWYEVARSHAPSIARTERTVYGCTEFRVVDPGGHVIVVAECQ
jgi:uncharacterized glyoxalase superfamily protein PhnB